MRPWLTGFSLCSAILLPLLMIGQTAPSEWLTAYCDELAPPVLSVVATGTVASLLGVQLSKRGWRGWQMFLIMLGAVALGFALSAPLLGSCLPALMVT